MSRTGVMEIATPVVAGMVLGIVCLNLAVAAAWFLVRRSRSRPKGQGKPSGDLPSHPIQSIESTFPSPSHSMNGAGSAPTTSLRPFTQPPDMHQIADNTLSRHSFGSILDSYSAQPPCKKPATATVAGRKRLSACSASVTLDSSSLYSVDSACGEGREAVPQSCTSLRSSPRVPYTAPRPSWAHQQSDYNQREGMSSVGPSPNLAPRVKWTVPGRIDCTAPTTEGMPKSYVLNSPVSTSKATSPPTSPIRPVSPLRLERKPLFLSRNTVPPSINSSSQRLSLISSSSDQPLLPGRSGRAGATHYEVKNETS